MKNSQFNQKYEKIIELVKNETSEFNINFNSFFEENSIDISENQIIPILKDFFAEKGKRIRSLLIFLFCKAKNIEINQYIYNIALINELIHNATLIHDDIIDCSVLRRGKNTLNFDYDSKLAVLAGDYLLCKALNILATLDNNKVQSLHSENLLSIIKGEIHQYFNRYQITSIEEYIEKSKNKTAKLFELGLLSCCYINNFTDDEIYNISKFALNFGIAFQINNDLKKFYDAEKTNEDIQNGDYSAPIIYYVLDKLDGDVTKLTNTNKLLKNLQNSTEIQKTIELKNKFIKLAIENLSFLEDNQYKKALIELCNLF